MAQTRIRKRDKVYLPTQLRPDCGTMKGYRKHIRLDEKACYNCNVVNNEKFRDYYANNSEFERNRFKKNVLELPGYKEAHDETIRKSGRKRRAQQHATKTEPYSAYDVVNKWGDNCHVCEESIDMSLPRHPSGGEGWEQGLHLDHVVPLSKGGTDTLDNVKPTHAICNLRKSAKHQED